jgi:hypothetical protein
MSLSLKLRNREDSGKTMGRVEEVMGAGRLQHESQKGENA